MLVFLIVILLFAALLEYLSLRGGTAYIDADFTLSKNRTEVGEDVELTTHVRRFGRLPVTYSMLSIACPLTARLPEGADLKSENHFVVLRDTYRLWTRLERSRTLKLQMEKRGVYIFSGRDIQRGDFLGLRQTNGHFDTKRSIIVYPPKLYSKALSEALGSYSGLLAAQRWLLRDPVLIMGVREYTGHEPMHAISWSQTARRGELTVREFDYTRSLNCRVLLPVNGIEDDMDLLDRCCSAVRTVCETLIEAGVEPVLYTNAALLGYPSTPMRSVSAAAGREEDLLEVLARVTKSPCCSPSALVEECLSVETGSAAYLLVTPHDDDAAQSALELLNARSGLGAKLIAVDELEASQDG